MIIALIFFIIGVGLSLWPPTIDWFQLIGGTLMGVSIAIFCMEEEDMP